MRHANYDRERPTKRQKRGHGSTGSDSDTEPEHDAVSVPNTAQYQPDLDQHPISPPLIARKEATQLPAQVKTPDTAQHFERSLPSPIQLTRIRDLPATQNVDTVCLTDILGDPMIKENWQFNYLLDVDFIMRHLDDDVRNDVQTRIVHGFWRQDDPRRRSLESAAERCPSVRLIAAHIPSMFGTHHSKLMVLLRHDDCVQIIIHTANMIEQDWRNLTQAVWRSPLLPLMAGGPSTASDANAPIGSGQRFKADLIRYLEAYDGRLRSLIESLSQYDFSSIRAALIASTPNARQPSTPSSLTAWGWPGLQQILQKMPQAQNVQAKAQLHVQISSVGTMTEKWLNAFFGVLGTRPTASVLLPTATKPATCVIFPTEDEVRRSLDGYAAGSSIHLKLESRAQQKQIQVLQPMLYQWAGDERPEEERDMLRESGRRRAVPHIKTYIRFSDSGCSDIDWALLTSANLSKQAWGEQRNKEGRVTIASYEIGVVVWPGLFANGDEKVVMRPTFKTDQPDISSIEGGERVVGLRMPYDLPLVPHGENKPWCGEQAHLEPDWKGTVWPGYKPAG